MSVTRSEENPSEIVVTWQPLTLLEARGFIEYLIQLYEVGSVKRELLSLTVPMDQDNATFSDLNTTAIYEVSVGTITVLSGDIGPGELTAWSCSLMMSLMVCFIVSARVTVPSAPTSGVTSTITTVTEPPTDPQIPITTIIIGLCVVVFVVVAMVVITVIAILIVRSRNSISKDSM